MPQPGLELELHRSVWQMKTRSNNLLLSFGGVYIAPKMFLVRSSSNFFLYSAVLHYLLDFIQLHVTTLEFFIGKVLLKNNINT